MEATLQRRGGNLVVSVSGGITIDSSPDFRALLLTHLRAGGCESLTVDLYGVEHVDTSALAVLLEVLKVARAQQKEFGLCGLRERPRYLLEATRLLHLFHEVRR
jgi:anti-anti-sigma factor